MTNSFFRQIRAFAWRSVLFALFALALCACGAGGGASSGSTTGYTLTAGTPSASVIFISSSAAAQTQSDVNFTLKKAGIAQANATLDISIDSQSLLAGVTFFSGKTTTSVVTDAAGTTPNVTIVAGTLPTSVILTATLSTDRSVKVNTTAIKVFSGNPVQDRFSLVGSNWSGAGDEWIEGWETDAGTLTLTASIADRLGNPVPAGTVVNFVSSDGASVSSSCTTAAATSGSSTCSVTLTSQGTRPVATTTRKVTVLAYAQGEETYTDANGNNKYDTGESFVDLGLPYLDKNADSSYTSGIDQVIGSTTNSLSCPSGNNSVPNSCNNTWDSSAKIRKEIKVTLLSSNNFALTIASKTSSSLKFSLDDRITGLQAPPKSTITTAFDSLPSGSTCAISSGPTNAPLGQNSSFSPINHTINYNSACVGQSVTIKLTTPRGYISTFSTTI